MGYQTSRDTIILIVREIASTDKAGTSPYQRERSEGIISISILTRKIRSGYVVPSRKPSSIVPGERPPEFAMQNNHFKLLPIIN